MRLAARFAKDTTARGGSGATGDAQRASPKYRKHYADADAVVVDYRSRLPDGKTKQNKTKKPKGT
jgi:hypothetical protein